MAHQSNLDTAIASAHRIDAELQSMVDDGSVVGASALVYRDGKEAYFGAFGLADDVAGRPMNRDTIAIIYSMTKPITGVALMTLYEQGLFDLDAPITRYVPELADLKVYIGQGEDGNPILEAPTRMPTVRDFMRHTAGLPGGEDVPPQVQTMQQMIQPTGWTGTLDAMPEKMARLPLQYHPGEKWRYSEAVDIQAVMVERLSGKPFAKYLQETIFDPLSMQDTFFFVPEDKRDRLAAVYRAEDDGELVRIPDEQAYAYNTREWPYTPGSYGLASTLDDYMRFARMLLNGGELDGVEILNPRTVELMATDALSDVTDRSWLVGKGQVGFGIDFAVRIGRPESDDENYGAVGEFFWDGAASTLFWVDPENNLATVFFIQRLPFFGEAHTRIRDAVYGVDR